MRALKWTAVGIAVLVVLVVAFRIVNSSVVNVGVAEELRDNPQGERAGRVMLVTLPDGREHPVNYLREGNLVFMGIDGFWWREFVDAPQPVTLLIQGETHTGHARAVLEDPAYTKDVFSRLRPTVPKWLPDALNGVLVVIELDT